MTNPKKPEKSLGSQVMRYGRISGGMAGLAAKLAGERFLGMKIEREEHAQQLLAALGNLKGPLMKVGQILATIPEALPPEYARAFQELQSNAPPMGWPFVRRRMKTELGADWESRFAHFEKEAAAAASLGQVHKATIIRNIPSPPPGGEGQGEGGQSQSSHSHPHPNPPPQGGGKLLVACKLQYPNMQSAIEADLNQLKIIFGVYKRYDNSINTQHIHAELSERLREELDYEREAKHCRLYEYMLREEPNVHVPEVIPELSTDRLLTTTWLEGAPILNFVDAPAEQRNALAMNMFRAWYVPLYYYGVIHGDPHLGNYTVRKDDSINLLDFGCIRVFPPEFVGGVIDLYNALMTEDTDLAVHAYETWGFTGLSKEQVETLNIWANFLYAPVMEDKVRPIGEVTNGVYGRETAEKVHKKLRELSREKGGITIPREFVFMDRAALGLGSVFLHLKAEVNWYKVFNELIQGFDQTAMAERQKAALDKFGL